MEWKLGRVAHIEAALLAAPASDGKDANPWTAVAHAFTGPVGEALMKLERYAAAARRAWSKCFDTIQKLCAADRLATERESRIRRNETEAEINAILAAPLPDQVRARPVEPTHPAPAQGCETKPMPAHLERELAAHKRRDPLFDPRHDASQMSKELRKWFNVA